MGSKGIAILFLSPRREMGLGIERQGPGHFTPWKDTVPIVWEPGWAPGPVRTDAENLASTPGFDPRTVQSVASRCTD